MFTALTLLALSATSTTFSTSGMTVPALLAEINARTGNRWSAGPGLERYVVGMRVIQEPSHSVRLALAEAVDGEWKDNELVLSPPDSSATRRRASYRQDGIAQRQQELQALLAKKGPLTMDDLREQARDPLKMERVDEEKLGNAIAMVLSPADLDVRGRAFRVFASHPGPGELPLPEGALQALQNYAALVVKLKDRDFPKKDPNVEIINGSDLPQLREIFSSYMPERWKVVVRGNWTQQFQPLPSIHWLALNAKNAVVATGDCFPTIPIPGEYQVSGPVRSKDTFSMDAATRASVEALFPGSGSLRYGTMPPVTTPQQAKATFKKWFNGRTEDFVGVASGRAFLKAYEITGREGVFALDQGRQDVRRGPQAIFSASQLIRRARLSGRSMTMNGLLVLKGTNPAPVLSRAALAQTVERLDGAKRFGLAEAILFHETAGMAPAEMGDLEVPALLGAMSPHFRVNAGLASTFGLARILADLPKATRTQVLQGKPIPLSQFTPGVRDAIRDRLLDEVHERYPRPIETALALRAQINEQTSFQVTQSVGRAVLFDTSQFGTSLLRPQGTVSYDPKSDATAKVGKVTVYRLSLRNGTEEMSLALEYDHDFDFSTPLVPVSQLPKEDQVLFIPREAGSPNPSYGRWWPTQNPTKRGKF